MTTTSTLTKKEFTARVRAFISEKTITQYNSFVGQRATYRFERTIDDIQRYARYNEEDGIPYNFENICYGIVWAIRTGRVNAQTVLAMRAMKVGQLIALVYEVGTKFDTIAEIPAYLIHKYTVQAA
jgi:hypothetical protein